MMTPAMLAMTLILGALQPPELIPTPKSLVDSGRRLTLHPGAVEIVVGNAATDPERYAADRLRHYVEKRFHMTLPVVDEAAAKRLGVTILVGRCESNGLVDRFCQENGVRLSGDDPGHDGYVIDFRQEGDRTTILIGGSNERGVTYGAWALFDLLQTDSEGPVLPLVTVRDWPSIPWRGHPTSAASDHLRPGTMDLYVRERINYIDIRWTPKGDHRTAFGIPPEAPLDIPLFRRIVAEAHKRGIFVYGTVACAVPPEKIGAVEKLFAKLLAIGVDGLWISYDDPGPGTGADQLVDRVLRLGERHGMTGHRVAITPPIHGYQNVEDDWNRRVAKVPGAGAMLWFFTRVPQAEDVVTARDVGIASLPGWWHNWPRVSGGLLYRAYGFESMYGNDRAYIGLLPLSVGWGKPDYSKIAGAAAWTDTVHVWGGGFEDLFFIGPIGIWAWNPQAHDWSKTSRAVYSDVFGRGQVLAAAQFDGLLQQLNALFIVPERRDVTPKRWPSRLKDPAARPEALKILDEMDAALRTLEARAPKETLLDEARLREYTLAGMRDVVRYGRVISKLEFPDYKYAGLRDKALALIEKGKIEEAKPILSPYRDEIRAGLAKVRRALTGFKRLEAYYEGWKLALDPKPQPPSPK